MIAAQIPEMVRIAVVELAKRGVRLAEKVACA
jgi:hypothetical protein